MQDAAAWRARGRLVHRARRTRARRGADSTTARLRRAPGAGGAAAEGVRSRRRWCAGRAAGARALLAAVPRRSARPRARLSGAVTCVRARVRGAPPQIKHTRRKGPLAAPAPPPAAAAAAVGGSGPTRAAGQRRTRLARSRRNRGLARGRARAAGGGSGRGAAAAASTPAHVRRFELAQQRRPHVGRGGIARGARKVEARRVARRGGRGGVRRRRRRRARWPLPLPRPQSRAAARGARRVRRERGARRPLAPCRRHPQSSPFWGSPAPWTRAA